MKWIAWELDWMDLSWFQCASAPFRYIKLDCERSGLSCHSARRENIKLPSSILDNLGAQTHTPCGAARAGKSSADWIIFIVKDILHPLSKNRLFEIWWKKSHRIYFCSNCIITNWRSHIKVGNNNGWHDIVSYRENIVWLRLHLCHINRQSHYKYGAFYKI